MLMRERVPRGAFDPWPLVTLVRSLMVAKVDSVGFGVAGALAHGKRTSPGRPRPRRGVFRYGVLIERPEPAAA